jgi:drug/metabolite transporter (DMT)-like permease
MGLAIASFAAMAVAARQLSTRMSTFEILLFRSVVSLSLILPLTVATGARAFATSRPWLHLCRNIVHFTGQFAWVYAIASLPLAEVTSLEFTSPLFAAILAALVLRERVAAHR